MESIFWRLCHKWLHRRRLSRTRLRQTIIVNKNRTMWRSPGIGLLLLSLCGVIVALTPGWGAGQPNAGVTEEGIVRVVYAQDLMPRLWLPLVVKGISKPLPAALLTATSSATTTSTPTASATETATTIATATATATASAIVTATVTVTPTTTATATVTATPASGYTYLDNHHGFTGTTYIDLSQIISATHEVLRDGDEVGIPLDLGSTSPPFILSYNGQTYNRLGIITDGYLVAGAITSADIQWENQRIPTTTLPNNVIAPYWTDLDLAPTGKGDLYYGLFGNVPGERLLVVQFKDVARYQMPETALNFEVIFFENKPYFVMLYGAITDTVGANLTVGVENITGTAGSSYFYNGDPPDHLPAAGLDVLWIYQPGPQPPAETDRQVAAVRAALAAAGKGTYQVKQIYAGPKVYLK